MRLVVLVGGLAAFAPLSFDLYLPAFPQLSQEFGASASEVQLTLTACLIGLGAGQILTGPLSDRLGRRRPLAVGLALYVAASIACALAPSVEALIVLRFVQGFAGGCGVVISRAIVRDLYAGREAVRLFSRTMLISGLAPILAPSLGGLLLHVTDWRGTFVVLAAIGVVLLVATHFSLAETLPAARRRTGGAGEALQGFGELVRDRTFVGYALSQGLLVGAIFAYISGSSFVLQDVYGLSPQLFALSFGMISVGAVSGSQLSAHLVRRHEPRALLLAGLATFTVGASTLLTAVLLDAPLGVVLPALVVTVSSVGFVIPNGTALALMDHPHVAGSASALLGVTQYTIGAVAAPFVGIAGRHSAVPMAVVMSLLGLGAIVSVSTLTRRQRPVPLPIPVASHR